MRTWLALAVIALLTAGGCAAILDIPDRSPSFCAREPHDICEDFDNRAAAYLWNGPDGGEDPRVTTALVPSDETQPNALSVRYPMLGQEEGAQFLIGSSFQRSPDGLRVAFDVRVEDLGLEVEAGVATAAHPFPSSVITLAIIQWNTGGLAVVLQVDGAYVYPATRAPNAPVADFRNGIVLAPRAEVVGKWNHVEIGLVFDVAPPVAEVRFGGRPSINPTLDPSVTQVLRTTDVLFGGAIFGPTGASVITYDNLQADFRKPVTP